MKKLLIYVLATSIIMSVFFPIGAYAEDVIPYKNLALGANVITNSRYSEGYHERNLVDGDYRTTYSDDSKTIADMPVIPRNTHYTIIDLGSECIIHTIILYTRTDVSHDQNRKNLCVEVSNDPKFQTWETVAFNELVPGVGSSWRIDFDEPIKYRYVKPCVRPNASSFTAAVLGEVEVYGERVAQGNAIEEYRDIEQGSELYDASKLLGFLGVMEGLKGSTDEFGKNMLVNRAEAANLIAKLLNNADAESVELTDCVYADVFPDTRYAGSIKFCKDSRIVSDGEFYNPQAYITVQEYLKMVLNAMGYSEYAYALGGYPTGYMRLAMDRKIGILPDNVNTDDCLSRENAALIMYQALNAPAMVVTGATNNNVISQQGDSFLKISFGYELKKGVVTANNVSNLKTDSGMGGDAVMIDNVEYGDPKALFTDFLGQTVYFMTDENQQLKGGWPDDVNDVKVLQSKDIVSVKSGTILAYNDDDKVKKIRIVDFSQLNVLKNGVAFNDYTESSFIPANGKLRLIDCEGDGIYETIDIYEPVILIVNYVTDDLESRILNINGHNDAHLSVTNYDNLRVYRQGKRIATDSIGMYNIIYAYVSENKKNIILEVSDTIVSGEVEAFSKDGITVEGAEYSLSDYYKAHKSEMDTSSLAIGRKATFLINDLNEVVWVVGMSDETRNEFVALVLQVGKTKGSFGKYLFKIFDKSGEIKVLNASDKLVIDGTEYRTDSIDTFLASNQGYFKNVLACLRLNSDGELVSIRTSNSDNNKEIVKNMTCESGYYKTPTGISYQNKVMLPLEGDIPVFVIPVNENDDVIQEGYERFFSVSTLNGIYGSRARKMNNRMDLYGSGLHNEPKYGVIKNEFITATSEIRPITSDNDLNTMLVEEVYKTLDSEGNVTVGIEGIDLITGKNVSVVFDRIIKYVVDSDRIHCTLNGHIEGTASRTWYAENQLILSKINESETSMDNFKVFCSDIDDIKMGDIICYRKNGDVGIEIERIYSSELLTGKSPYGTIFAMNSGPATSFISGRRLVHYNVDDITSKNFKAKGDSDSETIFYDNLTVKVMIVRNRTIEIVERSQIPSHVEKDFDVVMYSASGVYKTLVFYER